MELQWACIIFNCFQCQTHCWFCITISSRSSEQSWCPKEVGGRQCRTERAVELQKANPCISHRLTDYYLTPSAIPLEPSGILRITSGLNFLLLLWIHPGLVPHLGACKRKKRNTSFSFSPPSMHPISVLSLRNTRSQPSFLSSPSGSFSPPQSQKMMPCPPTHPIQELCGAACKPLAAQAAKCAQLDQVLAYTLSGYVCLQRISTWKQNMSFCCWGITEFQTLSTVHRKAVPATDLTQVRPV